MKKAPPVVLVVEDEDMVREVVREVLLFLGFQVIEAATAPEGLRIFDRRRAEIDLVLLDMTMPAMGGAELRGELRSRGGAGARVPILLSSAFPHEDVGHILSEDPRTRFLPKPYTVGELGEKLAECLALEGATALVPEPFLTRR
ncbi:response regulator [Geothrix sp. 21YS21S-4]|uniref:response regulator n=1 Tax=Geothrix sp. 21YS21S-4 TaxID=3068889 RepID=UPI0027BA69E7|nr:response regulator [Geothrix sp. 21YS21S-4]